MGSRETGPHCARPGMALCFLQFASQSKWFHRRLQKACVRPACKQRCNPIILHCPRLCMPFDKCKRTCVLRARMCLLPVTCCFLSIANLRGHWRCCRACAGIRLGGVSEFKPDTTMRECEKCQQHRPRHYFQESPSMCIACVPHADFEIVPCGKCDKPTEMQHWGGRWDGYGQ